MKLYSVFYYDCTGAKGNAKYDASNEIEARDRFLAQHPNYNIDYIETNTTTTPKDIEG
jgi:hypothetical protein